MDNNIELHKAALKCCETALHVIGHHSITLNSESDGQIIQSYQWLSQIKANLEGNVKKLESPEEPKADDGKKE